MTMRPGSTRLRGGTLLRGWALALLAVLALAQPMLAAAQPALAGWRPDHGHLGTLRTPGGAVAPHTHPYDTASHTAHTHEAAAPDTGADPIFTAPTDGTAVALVLPTVPSAPALEGALAYPTTAVQPTAAPAVTGVPVPPPRA